MARPSLLALAALSGGMLWATASIMSLFPDGEVIPGWGVVSGADKKGWTSDDLHSMYNGAAPEMMQSGIVAAGQRVYRKGPQRITVDVFRFRAAEAAMRYYGRRVTELTGKQPAVKPGIAAWTAARSGRTTVGCATHKGYCAMLTVTGTSPDDEKALRLTARHIVGRIGAAK